MEKADVDSIRNSIEVLTRAVTALGNLGPVVARLSNAVEELNKTIRIVEKQRTPLD